jgi:hypothetical protein
MGSHFKLKAIAEIRRAMREHKGITFNELLVKVQVNEPCLRQATAKQSILNPALDGQMVINRETTTVTVA